METVIKSGSLPWFPAKRTEHSHLLLGNTLPAEHPGCTPHFTYYSWWGNHTLSLPAENNGNHLRDVQTLCNHHEPARGFSLTTHVSPAPIEYHVFDFQLQGNNKIPDCLYRSSSTTEFTWQFVEVFCGRLSFVPHPQAPTYMLLDTNHIFLPAQLPNKNWYATPGKLRHRGVVIYY